MKGGERLIVRRGFTQEGDEHVAADELAASVANPGAAVVLVFASPRYDADRLAAALQSAMGAVPVVGCTTAGEIGPSGFVESSAVAMSLAAPSLRIGIGLADDSLGTAFRGGAAAVKDATAQLAGAGGELDLEQCVGLTLLDGRSGQEEVFVAGAASGLSGLRLVGGSASDVLGDEPRARVFHEGQAHADSGLVVIFQCGLPMVTFKSEHMRPLDRRVVVTEVDSRLVRELDGKPALQVYREIVGIAEGPIETEVAGRHPFAQYVGEQAYVRSVMGVEGDCLRFACAVDRGVVLRPVLPGDLVTKTDQDLRAADEDLGGMSALIAFNCLGRYFESEAQGSTAQLGAILARYPVVGFNTFGEQFGALHVNHTLTGLAFGTGRKRGAS